MLGKSKSSLLYTSHARMVIVSFFMSPATKAIICMSTLADGALALEVAVDSNNRLIGDSVNRLIHLPTPLN